MQQESAAEGAGEETNTATDGDAADPRDGRAAAGARATGGSGPGR